MHTEPASCKDVTNLPLSSGPNVVIASVNTGKTVVTKGNVREVQIYCGTDGIPAPTVTWRRPDGQVILLSDTKYSFTMKDTSSILTIHEYDASKDAGEYTCLVDNGVGGNQECPVMLSYPGSCRKVDDVISLPTVSKVSVGPTAIGDTFFPGNTTEVEIICGITGNPPPEVFWIDPNGQTVTPGPDGKYSIVKTDESSVLTIYDYDLNGDAGLYQCKVENQGGSQVCPARLTSVNCSCTVGPWSQASTYTCSSSSTVRSVHSGDCLRQPLLRPLLLVPATLILCKMTRLIPWQPL